MFYVRLPKGELVGAVAPEMMPFVKGKRVRVVKTTTKLGRVSYTFEGYAEAASNRTEETDARLRGAVVSRER